MIVNNPWKLVAIGMLTLGATSFASALTTAYVMRPSAPAETPAAAPAEAVRPAIVRVVPAPPQPSPRKAPASLASASPRQSVPPPTPAVLTTPEPAAEPAPEPAAAPAPPPVAAQPATAAVPVTPEPQATATAAAAPVASTSSECATGGDRAWKIAKPGLIGTAVGAGLGAVGGAIADGGKGAGKGALLGGLAGAALGGGYGAYKTKNECGTIFGNSSAPSQVTAPGGSAMPARSVDRAPARPEPVSEAPFAPTAGDAITVYQPR
jgi:hypothetical protein